MTITDTFRRAFRPAPTPTVVPLRPHAEHTPAPGGHGAGTIETRIDLTADGARQFIAEALLASGLRPGRAVQIMREAALTPPELLVQAATTEAMIEHSARAIATLERAMPGIGATR